MRRSPKPVLTVPPGKKVQLRRILCPVDGSNASARGLRNAINMAVKLKARLTVMTVITDFAMPLGASRRSPDMAKIASDYEKMEREQFEQFIQGFDFQDVTWDKEVHFGYPADQIVQLASAADFDLVVMGSTGRSGLPRLLLGSTAEAVARRAPGCLLTVKREDVLTAKVEAELADISRLFAEGEQLMEEGLYEEAVGRFDQCLFKNPYFANAVEGLALAHERLGHAELAADLHEQASLIRRELWQQAGPQEPVLG
jgi:nucleotide-binding universal stress UspA family protein